MTQILHVQNLCHLVINGSILNLETILNLEKRLEM